MTSHKATVVYEAMSEPPGKQPNPCEVYGDIGIYCSRPKGHLGLHRAYLNHDNSNQLIAEWHTAKEETV